MGLDSIKIRTNWAIIYIIEKEHLSNIKLAKKMGFAQGTINSYRRMTTEPSIDFILKFCELFHFSLLWFVEGIGYPFQDAWETHPESKGPKPHPKTPDYPGLFGPEADEPFIPLRERFPERYGPIENGDFIYIPQMSGRISAGGGLMPDNRIELRVAFRKDWLNRKGDSSRMSLVKVDGDSMEPTLISGDLVLIDHSRSYVAAQGGIYAIAVHNEIMIKRIHIVFPDGKLKIISDNPKYETMEAEIDKVHINGKVIWYGREIER